MRSRITRRQCGASSVSCAAAVPCVCSSWVTGIGEQRSNGRCASAGLGPNVTLLGTRSDVPALLAAADAALLTSLSEGIPLTLIEAVWRRTRAGGLDGRGRGADEVVVEGECGFLCPAVDARRWPNDSPCWRTTRSCGRGSARRVGRRTGRVRRDDEPSGVRGGLRGDAPCLTRRSQSTAERAAPVGTGSLLVFADDWGSVELPASGVAAVAFASDVLGGHDRHAAAGGSIGRPCGGRRRRSGVGFRDRRRSGPRCRRTSSC